MGLGRVTCLPSLHKMRLPWQLPASLVEEATGGKFNCDNMLGVLGTLQYIIVV
jgi:hypothetical protein